MKPKEMQEKIEQLEVCLKKKDIRLKKVEKRWTSVYNTVMSLFIVISYLLLIWGIISLPIEYGYTRTETGVSVIGDVTLCIVILILILAIVGLAATWYVIWWITNPEK